MADLHTWSDQAGENTRSAPDGAPEGWLSGQVNAWGRECMASLKRFFLDSEWRNHHQKFGATNTVSKNSDTSVLITGDHTALYTTNARVRISDGATTVYGHVVSAAPSGGNTIVTVTLDSGVVQAGANSIEIHQSRTLGKAAFKGLGAGSGLDADTLQGLEPGEIGASAGQPIINGDFSLWQRGTSFTTEGEYTADRWLLELDAGVTTTVSRKLVADTDTGLPGGVRHWLRWVCAGGATQQSRLCQRIEGVRSFSGQTITVSAYARATSALNLQVSFEQNFGTGGTSPNLLTKQTWALTTAIQRFTQTFAIPAVTPSLVGSAGDDYLELLFDAPVSAFDIDLIAIRVDLGDQAQVYSVPDPALELHKAQRFFWKSFPMGTTPQDNPSTGYAGSLHTRTPGTGTTGFRTYGPVVSFPALMRATPTVALYNPQGTDPAKPIRVRDTGATPGLIGDSAAEVQEASDRGFRIHNTESLTATNANANVHAIAEAEL